jgi:4-hydroxybenzoate polyprenyltransferase
MMPASPGNQTYPEMTHPLLRIGDYLFVLRPLLLIPAWSFYLIGAGEGLGKSIPGGFELPSIWTFAGLTAVLVTAYLLNQIFDRDSDAGNDKCPYLSRGIFGVRTLLILALGFYLLASTCFRRLEDAQRIPLIAALVLSLIYSLPPIRLCARPVLDLLANAVGFGGIAFLLGYSLSPAGHGGLVMALPYTLLVGATFLHTTILDEDGDRRAGKRTTTVLIGAGASRIAAVVLHGAAVATAVYSGRPTAVVLTAISLPLTLAALPGGRTGRSSIQVQGTTALVSLGAAVHWPAFALLIIPLAVLSRLYHRRRFDLNYPGIRKSS